MLKDRLLYGATFCAVEITVNQDGKEVFHCLVLKKKKKELVKKASKSFFKRTAIFDFLKNQQHVFLIINDKNVLIKKSDITKKSDIEILQYSYPNIQISDFYYEILKNEQASFTTICRKKVVDKLILEFEKKGISFIDVSLGNLSIEKVVPYLEDKISYTSNSKIEILGNEISSIQSNIFKKRTYNVNGIEVNSTELLLLSGIIGKYLNKKVYIRELNKKLSDNFLHKRFFSLGYKIALGFIFSVLLINFIVFSSYHSKVNKLQNELLINTSYKKQLITLKDLVDTKENLVQDITNSSSTIVSRRIDKLTQIVPNSILLNELTYQPLTSQIKEEKPIKVIFNQIVIKGVVKNNSDFSKWINTIENMNWIDKAAIIHFGKSNSKQQNVSFEILIHTKDEL